MEPKPDPLNDQLREIDPRLAEFIEPLLQIVNGCQDKRVQRATLQTAALIGAYLMAGKLREPILVPPISNLHRTDWIGFK